MGQQIATSPILSVKYEILLLQKRKLITASKKFITSLQSSITILNLIQKHFILKYTSGVLPSVVFYPQGLTQNV